MSLLTKSKNIRVLLFASQVAAACGLNRYQHPWKIMENMWKRYQHITYDKLKTQILNQNPDKSEISVGTEEDRCAALVNKYSQVKNAVQSIITKNDITPSDQKKDLHTTSTHLEKELNKAKKQGESKEDVELLKKFSQMSILCHHGNRGEEKIIHEHGITDNNKKFYKTVLGTCKNSTSDLPIYWGVGGRIDGFRNGILVEIKNRKNRFMFPLYDKIQIHCYMKLTGVESAILIQKLRGDAKEQTVQFDNNLWDSTVLPRMQIFADKYMKFISDESLKEVYLSLNNDDARNDFYNRL